MQIQLQNNPQIQSEETLISESAKDYAKAPDWWNAMSLNQQKAYAAKHPRSKLAKFFKQEQVKKQKAKQAKGSSKAKPVQEKRKVPKSREKDQDFLKTIRGSKSARKVPESRKSSLGLLDSIRAALAKRKADKLGIPDKPNTDFVENKRIKAPSGDAIKRKRRTPQEVNDALREKYARAEEKRRAEKKQPIVKERMLGGIRKFAENITSLASHYKDRMSPGSIRSLSDFIKAKKDGVVGEEHVKGQHTANKIILNATQAIIGAAAVGAIASGAAPLAGALTAAFFGFKDYRKGLEGTGKLDIPDRDFSSESSEGGADPVELLLDEYAIWVGNQDIDAISQKVAEFESLLEMQEEQWQPDPSQYTDGELNEVASAPYMEDEDADQTEEFLSESGIRPRLTLRLNESCRGRRTDLRNTYDVVYAGNSIGKIFTTDPFSSTKDRQWQILLEDGFNEAAYKSGRNEMEPYTLVNSRGLKLIHPVRQTYRECCAWVKLAVEKKYL